MVASILLLTLVHFVAFGLLFWHLAGREILSVFRTGGDEGRGGGSVDPAAPDPTGGRGGGLPLPDAAQAPVRLREPARLADAYPPRPRRPDHAPDAPERVPVAR
ncbi:MAG TPA: hypothetical protein VGW75_03485 [Solirubrobacteraceae bacterium]|nr:hypothetical protein [Solirubrobacteraceae bacterium]